MVVEQDELQNECRSRETCSFGTPDAVVCKAARSASAVLAAVGPSVGIGEGGRFDGRFNVDLLFLAAQRGAAQLVSFTGHRTLPICGMPMRS